MEKNFASGKEIGKEGVKGHFFEPKLVSMADVIRACIDKKWLEPALILIYSAIDIVAWLDSQEEWTTRKSFIDWTDKYLLKSKHIGCSAIEVYAARCGLLHTLSPESKLSRQGASRHIYYAWGTAEPSKLQQGIDSLGQTKEHIAIHINDLFEGWLFGTEAFLNDINNSGHKKSVVYSKASRFFINMKPSFLNSALEAINGSPVKQQHD